MQLRDFDSKPTVIDSENAQQATEIALSLKKRALHALARREYTRAELQKKLSAEAQNIEQLQSLLDLLEERGLLSDERAAESILRQKAPRFGAGKLRQQMQIKGFSQDLIDSSIQALQGSEEKRARHVWESKFGNAQKEASDWSTRQKNYAKQMRYMLSRGFSMAIAKAVVGQNQTNSSYFDE